MNYKQLTCPNCMAPFPPHQGKKTVTCEYCRSTFALETDLEEKIYEAEQEEKERERLVEENLHAEKRKRQRTQTILGWISVISFFVVCNTSNVIIAWVFILSLLGYVSMRFSRRRDEQNSILERRTEEVRRDNLNARGTDRNAERRITDVYRYGYDLSEKDRWLAFLLCLFLGPIGLHLFYVGRVGKGVLYLFTGGLFGIGWIIDLILILLGKFKDKNGRRLA